MDGQALVWLDRRQGILFPNLVLPVEFQKLDLVQYFVDVFQGSDLYTACQQRSEENEEKQDLR